ncbi:MAG: antibiotic biosynthesis monooxygenase [Planctomycetaceae bacterium]|nr:antibiotic biosynthesis monooxygenase [Planctomycetaceae bacterium]
MFAINVHLTVKDEADVTTVRDLLAECGRRSREEPGCVRYEVCHSQSNPRLFMLNERWADEQAWKDHKERAAVTEIYLPKVIPLVDRVPHISTLVE